MDIMQMLSGDFWFGFVGPVVITSVFAQVFKYYWEKWRKVTIQNWAGVPFGMVAGFMCAMIYEWYKTGTTEGYLFNWCTIPALTIIYATASVFVYRHFIKKYIEDATAVREMATKVDK